MRAQMVDILRSEYRIKNQAILNAMGRVRRHVFVPEKTGVGCNPYGDYPCPIGHGQTISQPFIVAHMIELMNLNAGDKVLEVGTGSGYQAAVLSALGVEVFGVEIIPELTKHARHVLDAEGYGRVKLLTGDGYKGWVKHAPYDAIIVACGPEEIPDELTRQLKDGGRIILPIGVDVQQLIVVRKRGRELSRENDIMVRFVPMVHGIG